MRVAEVDRRRRGVEQPLEARRRVGPTDRGDDDRRPEAEADREHLIEEQTLPAATRTGPAATGPERPDDQQVVRDLPEPPNEAGELGHELGGRGIERRRARRRERQGDDAQDREHQQHAVGGASSPRRVGSRREDPHAGDPLGAPGRRCPRLLGARRQSSAARCRQARRGPLLPLRHPPCQTPSIRPCCTHEAPAAVLPWPGWAAERRNDRWSVVECSTSRGSSDRDDVAQGTQSGQVPPRAGLPLVTPILDDAVASLNMSDAYGAMPWIGQALGFDERRVARRQRRSEDDA